MTHGSCKFTPPTDLEHIKNLLETRRKRREREGMSGETENGSGLTRNASLAIAPAIVQHQQSITTPTPTVTTSGHPSLFHSTSPSTSLPPSASTSLAPFPQPPLPPLQSSIKQNNRLSPSAILTFSDLSNISEHDLREVEREAERRLRPYACGVGECQRRYKNMNGLMYHYQCSRDHGAMGLALLASGQHECLSAGRRSAAAASSSGSMSVSASRNSNVSIGNSRTGIPQPLLFGLGLGVDVKPDVSVLGPAAAPAAPVLGGVRNTSPMQAQAQSQVQAQAQAYHDQLQLQQFQQQQIRDQQQRQQQQQQQQQNQQVEAQNQQQQNQQHHSQHQHHLATCHYAHMQRPYQAYVHATQQQQQTSHPKTYFFH